MIRIEGAIKAAAKHALATILSGLCVVACGGTAERGSSAAGAGGDSAGSIGGSATSPSAGASGSAQASSLPCVDVPCTDTGPRPTTLPRPQCPTTEPSVGDSCTINALYCGYGDSPAANCRRAYTCTQTNGSSQWLLDATVTQAGPCVMPIAGQCPPAAAPRMPCDRGALSVACQYPGLVCQCQLSSRDLPGWVCLGAPENILCPELLPNVGDGCAPNGIECDYAVNSCDPTPNRTLFCYQGAWERGQDLACAL